MRLVSLGSTKRGRGSDDDEDDDYEDGALSDNDYDERVIVSYQLFCLVSISCFPRALFLCIVFQELDPELEAELARFTATGDLRNPAQRTLFDIIQEKIETKRMQADAALSQVDPNELQVNAHSSQAHI